MGKFTFSLSGQNETHHSTRTLGRIFQEASVTGVLNLSGKNLKDFPSVPVEYDLGDTVYADLSKNKFTELPREICDFFLLAELNCYHNVIRCFPDSVVTLKSLTFLNLSRNQLCIIPPALCQLPLQVLIINNNKLVTLPKEIGIMNQLMDLDVGCNKITFLPPQIGELEALRSLNVRRNFLTQLPPELCELQLVKLDISGNKISFLPIPLYYMTSLQHLVVDKNPLISPLSILCERGKAHIFKYLEVQANCKSKKQRISLELDYHQSSKKASLFSKLQTENGFEDGRSNQHMFDSHKKSCHWSQDKLYDPVLKLTNGHLVDSLKGKSKNNIIPLKEKNDCSETQQKSTSGTTNGNISTHPIKWMGVSSSTSAVQTSFSLDYKHSSTHEESMNNNNGMLNSQKETFQDHPFKRKINGTNLSLGSKKSSILLNHQVDSDFIIKSRLSKARENKESIDKLRKIIKNELNITLPNDLGGALRDGILLCQLLNHLYPQSLVNIDMPSVTMPRLSVTKCRWNVENFLSSCEKTGVTKKDLFKWEEIVLQKEVTKVAHTVQILSSLCANKPKTVKPCCEFYLSWLLLGLLIGTCLMIILYPPPP